MAKTDAGKAAFSEFKDESKAKSEENKIEKLYQCKTADEAAKFVDETYDFKTYTGCIDFLAALPAAGMAFSEKKINMKEARDNAKAVIESLALDFDEKIRVIKARLEGIVVQMEEKEKTIAEKESEIVRLKELVVKHQAEMERIAKTR